MNKKANEPTNQTFWILIVALVVVIAFIFLGLYGGPIANSLAKYIPFLNSGEKPPATSEVIRFDIYDNTVSYYSETKYYPIKEDTEERVGDKFLAGPSIKADFMRYYYRDHTNIDDEKRGNQEYEIVDQSFRDSIWMQNQDQEIGGVPFLKACALKYSSVRLYSGTVGIALLAEKETCDAEDYLAMLAKSYALVFVTKEGEVLVVKREKHDDGIYLGEEQEVSDPEFVSLMRSFAQRWMNSVLTSPMPINYQTAENRQSVTSYFCVTPKDARYLVVDLSKPVPQTETC